MAIKTFKPTTPSRRFMTVLDSGDITAKASVRSLLKKLPRKAGRNNNGRITSRHKEAGAKKIIAACTHPLLVRRALERILSEGAVDVVGGCRARGAIQERYFRRAVRPRRDRLPGRVEEGPGRETDVLIEFG